jgi:hypothetical protein
VLAGTVLALNGSDLEMGRGHFSLHEELAPCGAYADDMRRGGSRIQLNERKAGGGRLRVKLSGGLHESK